MASEVSVEQQRAVAMARARQRQAEEGEGGTFKDMALSALSGLRQGAEGLVGGLGSANDVNASAIDWVAQKFGASPEFARDIGEWSKMAMPGGMAAPTTQQVQEATAPVLGEPYQPQTTAGEYARTIGEFAPAAAMGPGRFAQKAVTQALIPALTSETAGQLTEGTPLESWARTAGALGGGFLPSLVSPNPVPPARKAMMDVLDKEGVDLTAGQATGRKGLQYLESERGSDIFERQGEQFTKAALKRAGIDAPRADPEVMAEAYKRIGAKFDNLAAATRVPLDKQLQDDLLNAAVEYQSLTGMPAPAIERMMNRVGEIAAENGGVLQGRGYQNVRSEMGRLSKAADGPTKNALREMQEALDDAVERHMPPAVLPKWQEARKEYRNFLTLERAASGAGENAAMGLISPSQLRNATVQTQGRRNYTQGQGDFAELARAGEALMKPPPNSGTAGRLAARGMPSISAILGGGAGAMHSPEMAMLGTAAGSVVPWAAGKAMMSGPVQAYLSNQSAASLGGMSEGMRRALTAALLAEQQKRVGGAERR